MPNISACILSYNRAEYLCEAIDSVLQQTIKPSEIIIFDNGSDKSVYNRIRSYLDQGVNWIGSDINHPTAWNFRRAIYTAKSEYLFVLHDDDRLCIDFIEQQIGFLKKNPDIGAVTCNGYLINAQGNRTGRLLRQDAKDECVVYFRSPEAVAICYASDSCLPFSPVVYRTSYARSQDLRDEFGKVLDAIYFCDLAKLGAIAYQLRPLYECRVHGAQDSSLFADVELDRLTQFFETLAIGSNQEQKKLAHHLIYQYTSRQLLQIYRCITPPFGPSVLRLLSEIPGLFHRRFSIIAATKICITALKKRIHFWINS
jgi:hypothetical protein